jgi:regulator of sigma E protease
MENLFQLLGTARDLVLVIVGFGLIIFVHELGHFLAARWAGIRVLAFAIGFGPAVATFRKGMGFRLGSSEPEYRALLERAASGAQAIEGPRGRPTSSISPTEYRFNILPLGGYVKMLGQEDLNPNAISAAPDSYQRCVPWKRMVVISAGVVMNLLTAAGLFILVFMVGLRQEPAKVGIVHPGTPAATALARNAERAGITTPGLLPGDELLSVDGDKPNSFNDLVLATAMAEPGESLSIVVKRPGVLEPLQFLIKPVPGQLTGLLELGVDPSRDSRLMGVKSKEQEDQFAEQMSGAGFAGLKPGMRLVSVNGAGRVTDGNALSEAVRRSEGRPIVAEFEAEDGARATITIEPTPQLQVDHVPRPGGKVVPEEHLLGLTPVMTVRTALQGALEQGLQDGDIFARIGSVEYPSVVQGMSEVKASRGKTIPVVVLRSGEDGVLESRALDVRVSRKGTIGFAVGDTSKDQALVAMPPRVRRRGGAPGGRDPTQDDFRPAASQLIVSPGTRIVSIGGMPVSNFADMREAIRRGTRRPLDAGEAALTLRVDVQRPVQGVLTAAAPVESFAWALERADAMAVHALGWEGPLLPFEHELVERIARTPVEAIKMGVQETHRVMLTTYVTFARLAQGTVKIEHLKGPVGIAHLGTLVAGRGFIWLLFFLALISVNLAVINFLPLPIVDGGQFLFLVYEQVRGRPVPLSVQTAVTMAGLLLIGSMFLIVTYNDITNLLGL